MAGIQLRYLQQHFVFNVTVSFVFLLNFFCLVHIDQITVITVKLLVSKVNKIAAKDTQHNTANIITHFLRNEGGITANL